MLSIFSLNRLARSSMLARIAVALIAALMAFRFRTGRWKTIELIEPELVDA